MRRLRFSYLVLSVCAALLVYGLIDASGRTAAVFVDVREATGFVDASVSFPNTPTTSPATEEPVETPTAPRWTTTPERTSSPRETRTPHHTASPQRPETPERTPSPVRTVGGERTAQAEETPESQATRLPSTSEPDETPSPGQTPVAEQTAIASSSPQADPTENEPSSTPTNTPSTPTAQSTSALSPTVAAVTQEPTARTTAAAKGTTTPESCKAGEPQITFTDVRNYSGPGPYVVGVAVSNGGASAINDVVVGFSAVSGAEYLDEAAFENGQLWWAHGQPDAAVLYAIPELNAGASTTIDLAGSLTSTWASGASVALNVSVVAPACATGATVATLTLDFAATAASQQSSAESSAAPVVTPSVTATPVEATAPPVRTVLGVSEVPAAATAAALGQTLPDTGAGAGGTGTTTWIIIAGLSLALVALIAGAIVASRWFPEGGEPPDRTNP